MHALESPSKVALIFFFIFESVSSYTTCRRIVFIFLRFERKLYFAPWKCIIMLHLVKMHIYPWHSATYDSGVFKYYKNKMESKKHNVLSLKLRRIAQKENG